MIYCVQQLQEFREKKLAEKRRLAELMKPREDQLCEDSKVILVVYFCIICVCMCV